LDSHDIGYFFKHVLERIDWRRDLHFQTKTTIDTLDYSGSGWNEGSKVIMACCGPKLRNLGTNLPEAFALPDGFSEPKFVMPGVLAIKTKAYTDPKNAESEVQNLVDLIKNFDLKEIAMILLVDDSEFTAFNINNFVWVTFTRANPSHDIYGVGSFTEHKHWGCTGPLIIDSRIKPHHAPALEVDKKTKEKIDQLFAKGGELEKYG
jgi:4-hydroxy-3-polyprenylbenzoate decarboxylase